MSIFLSILIPTRNRAEYLRYAIQSALNIKSNKIEIIVSENHSVDNSWDVCNSFCDNRLRVYKPEKFIPMYENFEFLLKKSSGDWVTFIGDDDAVMPHCFEHLSFLTIKYPQAEAIVSPRAYYFWDGCQQVYGKKTVSFIFRIGEIWQDSKKKLKDALDGKIDYIYLPQMYSGGFHRRSLIDRVLKSQNGIYFKSIIPDSYTALMACVHTYRYLETGIPMTWVGSSPHQEISLTKGQAKNRKVDFFGYNDNLISTHKALGSLEKATFPFVFLEAYLCAFPTTSFEVLNQKKIKKLFFDSAYKFFENGDAESADKLSDDLGFNIPFFIKNNWCRKTIKISKQLKSYFSNKFNRDNVIDDYPSFYQYRDDSHEKHPNILSCDYLLHNAYSKFESVSIRQKK